MTKKIEDANKQELSDLVDAVCNSRVKVDSDFKKRVLAEWEKRNGEEIKARSEATLAKFE